MAHPLLTALGNLAATLGASIMEAWNSLQSGILGSYHPERHYMRGRGAKWRKKHPDTRVT
jgi:hypothetical protein